MNNQFCQHVLVFDSGFGGLSVAREIHQLYPNCQLSYLADNAYFPYGVKPDAALTHRICGLLGRAIDVLKPDIVVVACNTASTIVLAELRQQFPLPFVGVVPAIKPAASLTKTNTIGLLATPATVNRAYTNQLIQDFAAHTTVVRYGSNSLVMMAESYLLGEEPSIDVVRQEMESLLTQPGGEQLDTVVLACTHFPLLKNHLMAAAPAHLTWVDSGLAVARQVGAWLNKLAPATTAPMRTIQFFYTGHFKAVADLQVSVAKTLNSHVPVELQHFHYDDILN